MTPPTIAPTLACGRPPADEISVCRPTAAVVLIVSVVPFCTIVVGRSDCVGEVVGGGGVLLVRVRGSSTMTVVDVEVCGGGGAWVVGGGSVVGVEVGGRGVVVVDGGRVVGDEVVEVGGRVVLDDVVVDVGGSLDDVGEEVDVGGCDEDDDVGGCDEDVGVDEVGGDSELELGGPGVVVSGTDSFCRRFRWPLLPA